MNQAVFTNTMDFIFQVLEFMVKEKLPKEINAKKLELHSYEDVINERNINNQYLSNLQNQVFMVANGNIYTLKV